jgi:hypothetical protein
MDSILTLLRLIFQHADHFLVFLDLLIGDVVLARSPDGRALHKLLHLVFLGNKLFDLLLQVLTQL